MFMRMFGPPVIKYFIFISVCKYINNILIANKKFKPIVAI